MKLVDFEAEFLDELSVDLLKRCEFAGRTCYKSRNLITDTSYEDFIRKIIKSGHESVLEHASIGIRIVCDRAIMAELTRHRHAGFSVESTRYVNGKKHGICFVKPHWLANTDNVEMSLVDGKLLTQDYSRLYKEYSLKESVFIRALLDAECAYLSLLKEGLLPEDARAVLPNALTTELVCTCNLRELRHILKLRTSNRAHKDIRRIFNKLLDNLLESDIKVLAEDIERLY